MGSICIYIWGVEKLRCRVRMFYSAIENMNGGKILIFRYKKHRTKLCSKSIKVERNSSLQRLFYTGRVTCVTDSPGIAEIGTDGARGQKKQEEYNKKNHMF